MRRRKMMRRRRTLMEARSNTDEEDDGGRGPMSNYGLSKGRSMDSSALERQGVNGLKGSSRS